MRSLGLTLSTDDLEAHLAALGPGFDAYNLIDRLPDELPPVTYPRWPGRRPEPEENLYGAWYVTTEVAGASSGKLAGKSVALKDNICLAGVAMMPPLLARGFGLISSRCVAEELNFDAGPSPGDAQADIASEAVALYVAAVDRELVAGLAEAAPHRVQLAGQAAAHRALEQRHPSRELLANASADRSEARSRA